MQRLIVGWLTGLALVLAGGEALADAYKLVFAPTAADEYALRIVSDIRMIVDSGGESRILDRGSETQYVLTVRETSGESTNIDVTIASISLDMADIDKRTALIAPGMALNPEERMRLLEAMGGASFSMDVAPDGTIRALEVAEALPEKVVDTLELTGRPREQALTMARTLLSEDNLRQEMEKWLRVYTSEEVRTGDTWEATQAIPLSTLNLEAAVEYTLTSLLEGEAIVSEAATLEGTVAQQVPPATAEGSGMGQTRLLRPGGWPLEREASYEVESDLGGGPLSMRIEVRTRIVGERR